MAVEVYLGRLFHHGHERRALGKFLKKLIERANTADGLFMVVVEVDANSAAMDLLLLSSRCIIIADLKQLTAAHEKNAPDIHLAGKENGQWTYTIPPGGFSKGLGGGGGKDKNPYKQLDQMRHKFADWLVNNSQKCFGKTLTSNEALDRLRSWAVICPGFDGDKKDLALPWDQIFDHHNWFQVISLDKLDWEFYCTTDIHFEYTERELRELITQLGADRLEHLGQVLPGDFPDDLPPAPRSFLFSQPPTSRYLVGRDAEMGSLVAMLEDPFTSMICLKGLGGVGKSKLAGAAASAVQAHGCQVRWVECREKELTLEMLLAATAAEVKDSVKANLILDKNEVKLTDRLDMALDYWEQEKTLLVLDDFHKANNPEKLFPLFSRISSRSERLKVLIISREHPECLENPGLPPGAVKEMILEGLDKKNVRNFFLAYGIEALDASQLKMVWERTRGNPYAMGLLRTLTRKNGWGDNVRCLPLYQSDQAHWFDSLMETLPEEARQLAIRLSVVRSNLSQELINFLWHDPQLALRFTGDLQDSYILWPENEDGDLYRMHEFVREYLYGLLPERQKVKTHTDAGKYYQRQAESFSDPARKEEYFEADALFEAIYHFELAEDFSQVKRLAQRAFDLLHRHGDWTRAYGVASQALKAARTTNNPLEIPRWLVRMATWEFDHDQMEEAGSHLQQALEHLSLAARKEIPAQAPEIARIKSGIYLEKGRVAYRQSEFENAIRNYSDSVQSAREAGDEFLYAECLMRIGRVERQRGKMEEASARFEEVKAIALRLNDQHLFIQTVGHLGLIARQNEDYPAAWKCFRQAYEGAQKNKDLRGAEINLSLMADLARREKNYRKAADTFRCCLEMSEKMGSSVGIRISMGELVESLIFLGELTEAEKLLDEVEKRCIRAQDGIGTAWALRRRGLLMKKKGDVFAGNDLIRLAIKKLEEIDSQIYIKDFKKDLESGASSG